jgi:Flp pilus assembly protein TadD
LRRLVQIQPHDASAYVNLGVALLNIHQNVEAFTVLSRAADLDPASINAWLNLGVAAMRLYKLPEAERALRRAQELAPDHPTVLENLRQLRLIRSKTGEDQSESPIVAPRNANAGP